MLSRSCSRNQNAVGNTLDESPKHLIRDTSIEHPPIYHSISTVEGYLQELERLHELRQQHIQMLNTLADRSRNLKLRMTQMLRSPDQSYSAEGKAVKKIS